LSHILIVKFELLAWIC